MNRSVVISNAIAWWLGRRPVGWNAKQHLANPEINCTGKVEHALARSVANVVRGRKT